MRHLFDELLLVGARAFYQATRPLRRAGATRRREG